MTASREARTSSSYAAEPADRQAPLEMPAEEFRAVAHALVDRIADFLGGLRERPVMPPGADAGAFRALIERTAGTGLPERGAEASRLVDEAASIVLEHSTLIAHPRFFGYIVGSPSPIGVLGDLLAAAANQNVGGWTLSPMATEVERQTVRWLAELVGLPEGSGGLLVSGGNMANIVCTVAARAAKAGWDVRERGMAAEGAARLTMYASAETHTWVQKAADLCGLGTEAIRWIPTDDALRMRVDLLRERVADDLAAGRRPFMVVATAGSVSTGAIDPVSEIADLCEAHDLWLHVDGAYGAPAAALPDAPADLKAIARADSIAIDPHKWLYVPVEAGCALVRDPEALRRAFSYTPPYYHFAEVDAEPRVNFYEFGPQNSRAFRALKVWLTLRQAGREGITRMVADDIALGERMHEAAGRFPELERGAHGLSIATMRYVPPELAGRADAAEYLDALNQAVLERIQAEGECFLSNAVLGGRFFLRGCIVNFRTTAKDVDAVPEIVVRVAREVDAEMRPAGLKG
ncbi:MAG TPA: aminotransferase class V-fold PLP-dependent enzyme [Gemmatimonadaceae bacterium]|nr:aminotransferase class V-fold PLP-dependent enzyme [Gemmatimonadaceae bacterium]